MIDQMIAWLKVRLYNEEGATAVEYGVMVALIAVVVIAGALALGQNTNQKLGCTASTIGTPASQITSADC